MRVLHLGAVILLLSVLSFTLPVQVALASSGYLRIVDVTAPENALVGEAITMSVAVEWSSLYTFKIWGTPTVRVEICEGYDVVTCKAVGFAPSEDGDPIKDAYASPTSGKTYSIEVQAPEQAGIWHLIAIFEIAASEVGATLNAVWRGHWAVVSSGGYDPWHEFDVIVKPNETALLTSQTLLTESFESGLGGWKVEGLVTTVEKNLAHVGVPEGHTGRFAALLGIDWSNGGQNVIPSSAGYASEFSLQRETAVTPGSDLTVTFWYRGVFPYGRPQSNPAYEKMFLEFSVISTAGTLDQVTIHNDEQLTDDWQSLTRSMSVPVQASSLLILEFHGEGASGSFPYVVVSGFELDDIWVGERVFSTATAVLSTTATQTETKPSQTGASTSSVETGSRTLPLQTTFLQTSWPYLVVALGVAAIAAIVLVASRKRGGTPSSSAPISTTTPAVSPSQPTAGKFCMNCGAPLPSHATFCNKCDSKQ